MNPTSPARDAGLHVSTSTTMPPTIAPNAEIGQQVPDAPIVLFGDNGQATSGDDAKTKIDGAATDPDQTLTGDQLIDAGHDNVPWRRGGI